MASPLTEKTLIQIRSFQDQETGCSASDKAAFELCKQSFYLKQQNELMQKQQTNNQFQQENTQLKTELETLRQEIETLKSQQTTTQTETQPAAQVDSNLLTASMHSTTLPIILLGVVLGSVATLLIRKLVKRL